MNLAIAINKKNRRDRNVPPIGLWAYTFVDIYVGNDILLWVIQ